MSTATDTPEFCMATLARPESVRSRTWTGETWVNNTPTTTFVRTGERVWLLTAGSRCEWRCMGVEAARVEWRRLRALGYERSERHVVEVVAIAELGADTQRTLEDDIGLRMYRAGTVRAGLAPVLRDLDQRYRNSSWTIPLDMVITEDSTSVRAVGSSCVETKSIYGYEVVTALVEDEEHCGWRFYGVSDRIGALRIERRDGGRPLYVARDIAA